MNSPLRLRGGDPLDAVDAALVAEVPKDALAAQLEDDLLEAAEFSRAGFQRFDLEANTFSVAIVHAPEIGGEEACLIAAGAGADFQDRVLILIGIGRQEGELDVALELGDAVGQLGEL